MAAIVINSVLSVYQVLANFKILKSRNVLKAVIAANPPPDIELLVELKILSINEIMTIKLSNKFNGSLAYYLNPWPTNRIAISRAKRIVKIKLENSSFSISSVEIGYLSNASVTVFAIISIVVINIKNVDLIILLRRKD